MNQLGKFILFSFTLFLCVFLAGSVFAAEISLSTLQLNGAAQIRTTADGQVLRLISSNGQGGIVGSAYTTGTVVTNTFSTSFSFRISESGGLAGGADGIAFVLQTTSPNAIGSAGGWLGYQNFNGPIIFPNSIAVEFDTYDNSNEPLIQDTSGNHIGIDTNGSVKSIVTADVLSGSLKNGGIWYSWIDYNGTSLEVRLNQSGIRPGIALLAFEIDIAGLLGGNGAYAGFSAGEAAGVGSHDILSWDYSGGAAPVPEPSTMLLLGSGLVGLVGYGRRRMKK